MENNFSFSQHELNLLRSSVKCFYTTLKCHSEFAKQSLIDEVYMSVLHDLKDLYWKLFKSE